MEEKWKKYLKLWPALIPIAFFITALIVLLFGEHATSAVLFAVIGLGISILFVGNDDQKRKQKALSKDLAIIKKRKQKSEDGIFGEDRYDLFKKERGAGSLDDLSDDEINKRLK